LRSEAQTAWLYGMSYNYMESFDDMKRYVFQ
jgi:hypothetical protein